MQRRAAELFGSAGAALLARVVVQLVLLYSFKVVIRITHNYNFYSFSTIVITRRDITSRTRRPRTAMKGSQVEYPETQTEY